MNKLIKPREFWLDHDCYYTQEEIEYSVRTEYPINPVNLIHTIEYSTYQALLEQAEKMAEVLDELTILMEDVRLEQYDPDSFTTQPAKEALKSWKEFKK